MKQFHNETKPPAGAAQQVVEVAWRVLQLVKAEVPRGETPGLTLTQMRSLGFLLENPGASLSELAGNLGLQKPTTSKVVEELAQQGRLTRTVVPDNRRKVALYITARGIASLEQAAAPAILRVAELLEKLTPHGRNTVATAMSLLQPLVQPDRIHDPESGGKHAA